MLKVGAKNARVSREVEFHQRIDAIETEHPGKQSVRNLADTFSLDGPQGTHVCLVHPPLGMTLHDVCKMVGSRGLSAGLMQKCVRQIMVALHFLHTEAAIIHTGSAQILCELTLH